MTCSPATSRPVTTSHFTDREDTDGIRYLSSRNRYSRLSTLTLSYSHLPELSCKTYPTTMSTARRSARDRNPKLAESPAAVNPEEKTAALTEGVVEKTELDEPNEVEEKPKPSPSFDGTLMNFSFTRATRSTTALLKAKSKPTSSSSSKKRTREISVKEETSASSSKIATTTTRKRAKRGSKQSSRYAPPEKYAHLGGVTDAFTPNLISVFIGLNPGIATATAGHAYAAPSNHFWKFLHSSGLTPDRQCPPETDTHLPRLYSLGNTNLVARATKDQAELSKEEMDASVEICEEKIRKWKPESVCIVGKGIWESIWRAKHGGKKLSKEEFVWGWQADKERFGPVPDEGYEGAKVFVVPSTSGLVAGYSMEFKRAMWKELGDWVQQRRAERGETAPRTDSANVETEVDE